MALVPFGTWDGTGRDWTRRNGTSRSVPRLVRLKTVKRVVPWDKIWLIFRSTFSPGTTRSTSMEHKFITFYDKISPYLFQYLHHPFHHVPSRPVPSCSVQSRPVCIPNGTLRTPNFARNLEPIIYLIKFRAHYYN
ncbi:hypothetical protein DVH24_001097 [Malus domestica]|uniref:Uncharacterized protein n=1 Tax=Malus domestica TaxID=3750 RepID=A0A498K5C4_MALDO|nr:hypothetical protein DVH24_001097 [Malus domestica]